ncbi:MAG: DUF2809 domain-containing protein [Planctomycetota bacterium]
MMTRRLFYSAAGLVTMLAGLGSRKFRGALPTAVAPYAGDTLWALMLFLLVSAMLARSAIAIRAAISLGLAFSVEFSQLYHAPWIDSIRQTTLGGLVLGSGFLGSDLICYSVGIAVGVGLEWVFRRFSLPKLKAPSGN